jgi:hypothetical protein
MVSKRVELLDVINRSSALALDGEAQKNAKGWVGCFRLVADARAARANEYYRPGAVGDAERKLTFSAKVARYPKQSCRSDNSAIPSLALEFARD